MKKIPLFPILSVNFIGTLGFSIVLPFLVFLVTKFGGSAIVYGIMSAVYPAFQLIGGPLLGKWSDIYGRKKILAVSQAGTLAGWSIFLIALFVPVNEIFRINTSFTGLIVFTAPLLILFLARAIDGITGGNISVANAYLADITDTKDRNKNFGKMSISSNLGFIAGPALAGLLGATAYAEKLPVIAAILISLAALVVILVYLPESNPVTYHDTETHLNIQKTLGRENKECYRSKEAEKISLKNVLKLEFIPFFLILYFLIFLGFNFFYTSFPVYVVQSLGWSLTETGMFYTLLSLLMIIVQGPVLGFLSKKIPESKLIIIGNIILAANFVLLYSGNTFIIYLAAVFFALGNGLMWPSFLSLLSKAAGKKYQGSVQGFANSMGSLASIVGLIAGGVLYAKLGAVTFLVAAGVILIVFILSFRLLPVSKKCEVRFAAENI